MRGVRQNLERVFKLRERVRRSQLLEVVDDQARRPALPRPAPTRRRRPAWLPSSPAAGAGCLLGDGEAGARQRVRIEDQPAGIAEELLSSRNDSTSTERNVTCASGAAVATRGAATSSRFQAARRRRSPAAHGLIERLEELIPVEQAAGDQPVYWLFHRRRHEPTIHLSRQPTADLTSTGLRAWRNSRAFESVNSLGVRARRPA